MYNLLIAINETRPEHCDIKLIQNEQHTTAQEKRTGDFIAHALVYVLDKIKLHGELTKELQQMVISQLPETSTSSDWTNSVVENN